jgi:hypothetical protein
LTTKAFGGLNKKNYQKKSGGNFGLRIKFEPGKRVTTQFAGTPDDPSAFKEFFQHSWKEGNSWNFVPCTGDDCPLCEEEDQEKSKTSYRFIAKVYDFGEKKMMVMEGPKDLAGRIVYQWERSPSKFLTKVWDVMALETTPRTYQVDYNDEVRPKRELVDDPKTPIDLDKYLEENLKRYYGEDGLVLGKSSLDDDDDDAYDEDEEDDDDEQDDQPAPRRRRESARKSTTTPTRRRRTRR